MDFYLDEKQRKRRRRILKLKIYGGIFLFFILAIAAAYLVIYSPLFQIKNIRVVQVNADEKQTDADNLIQNLKNFFVSQSKIASFLGPDNILIWNSNNLCESQKNPEIAELSIEKDYFNREVKINIKQREKFGVWCAINPSNDSQTATSTFVENSTKCFWFDKNGVIFSEAPIAEGNLINKVDDFSGRSLNLSDLVFEERFYSNLIKIFDVLEKSDLGIKSLKLERPELQEISTESSPKIYFSLRIDPNFGLSAIESLKSIGLEKIEYIDLRVENRAYYKMK